MARRAVLTRVLRMAGRRAGRRPTPFFVFDVRSARVAASLWRTIAKRHALDVFYPYKCNRHPSLVRMLAEEGLGAEVTAPSDLETALAIGLPGSRVVVQGPAKSDATVDRALAAGALYVADGVEDALALMARARALSKRPRYLVRFAAGAAEAEQRRFGARPNEILAFARRIRDLRLPTPSGLAFHLGTGLASAAPYLAAIAEAGRIAAALRERGIHVSILDVGGGYPAAGEARRDGRGRPRRAGAPVDDLVSRLARRTTTAVPGARLCLEPGRALAADAFHLVARVLNVRGARVYLDASRMSHAFFVPRGVHPFRPLPRRRGGGRREIAGPLAVGLDVLSGAETVGRPRKGDLMVIGSVGAYNLIAANAWAGSLPEVIEI